MMVIKRSFRWILSFLLVLIIVDQIFGQKLENLIVIALLIPSILIISIALFQTKILQSPRFLKRVMAVSTVLNLALLLYVALHFQINDVSDPLNVQIKATELLNGNYDWHTNLNGSKEYFYLYPNVVFFTILLSKFMGLGLSFGWSVGLSLRLLNFVLLAGVTIFSLATSWRIRPYYRSLAVTAVVLLFYPVMYLYPNLVTYTDTWTMFLSSLIFFLVAVMLTTHHRPVVLIDGLILMLAFALLYIIKANMVILIPAALLLFLLIFIFKIRGLWQSTALLAALIFGLGIATIAVKPVYQHYGYSQADQAKIALPVTHWINMGLNPLGSSGQGAYDKEDEHLDQQRKAQKRTDLITESIQKRLKMLGVSGVVKLGITKSQILLGRSLFGFGRYMSGYAHAPAWYLKHQSLFNTLFSILATTILLMVMGNFLYSLWRPTYEEEFTDAQQAFFYFIGLAGLGLAFFHSFIWEVEPRYFLPLLYPLIILGLLFLPSEKGHGGHHPWRISYNRTTLFVLPICSLLMLTLTLDAAKNVPGVAYGNMEYSIRIALRQRVKVTDDLHFSLPVPQAVDVLKVDIRPEAGQSVFLSTGQQLTAMNGHYVLEKHFAANQKIEVVISRDEAKAKSPLILYRQPTLYKQLFHGSSVTIDGRQYYLPYEMDIYDRKPFELLDVNNQPVSR